MPGSAARRSLGRDFRVRLGERPDVPLWRSVRSLSPSTTGDWVRFGIAAGGSALVPLLWLCRAHLAGRLDWRDPRDWFPYSLLVCWLWGLLAVGSTGCGVYWLWGLPAAATFAHFLRGVHEGHHDRAWMPRVFGRAQAITLALLIGLPAAYYITTWLPLGPDDAWWRTLFRRRRWWWW